LSHYPIRRTYLLFVLITCLLAPAASARAQGTAYASITPPDISKFPIITTYMDAFDDQQKFITSLAMSDIFMLENGKQITPDKVENLKPALSFVLAINSDPSLGVRDGFGDSRYDKIVTALSTWAASRPSGDQDKLALVWNGGVIATRLSPADWKTRLAAFDPAPRTSTSSLSALAFALDASQEAQTGSGGKKAILLISPHLGLKDQTNLNDLISRAKEAGVRVFVWITDSRDFQTNPGSSALQDLALGTGGQYTAFTGSETLPDIESWLSTLRNVYQLTYTSKIRAGGQQSLSVQINNNNQAITSLMTNFSLDIQPPSAMLLSAPIEIVRQNPQQPFDTNTFAPRQQEISALVEFPDGKPRPLTRTTLYVDGLKIAENTAEPFNRFTWDLSVYIVSGEHRLQVEAEDSLGLSQKSAEVPVQVTVIQPPGGIAGLVLRNRVAVTISFLVLAGGVLLGIIILGGRRGLATLTERRKARAAQLDPVTQPLPAEAPSATRENPFPWLRRKADTPPAYFVKLTADGAPAPGDPIPLLGREITFGTDPTQSTHVLDHASLSALHARLRHLDDNTFTLLDQNSVAGTWVNYDLIPLEGRALQHGDVIHFAQLTYRFVLTKPPAPSKPSLTPIPERKPGSLQ
jgi:hypothetical protein